jgi:hypothetical protein
VIYHSVTWLPALLRVGIERHGELIAVVVETNPQARLFTRAFNEAKKIEKAFDKYLDTVEQERAEAGL